MMEEPIESGERYKIRYDIRNEKENEIADILWLRKVAKFCIKRGIPGFNIIEESINENFVEGVIEFEEDRMKAQYDSYEILELELPEL